MPKIHCLNPNHEDRFPSMEVYPDGHGFCFACHYYVADAGKPSVQGNDTYVENVSESVKHIKTLPLRAARGLSFHHDPDGFYILWPGDEYYKYRREGAEESGRYLSPVGVKKPLFWANRLSRGTLFIVEGEINALSLAKCFPEYSVCSPGPVSDFVSKRAISDYLPQYLKYEKILVIGDHDDPGVKASTLLMLELQGRGKDASVVWMRTDANDLLQQENGESLVRQEVEQLMAMRGRLRRQSQALPPHREAPAKSGETRGPDDLHGRYREVHG